MRCKKQKKNKFKVILIIAIIFIVFFSYFHFFVNPQIVKSNTANIKSYTIGIINSATASTISSNDYDDLIEITKSDDGSIALMQVKTKNVNRLNNQVMTEIQNALNDTDVLNYKIPMGSFSGIPLLSGLGPKLNLKIVPIGNVNTQYKSQIASLSINQSYHKIYLTISVTVSVILPLFSRNIVVSNQILIGESIIVGKIPNTYLNTDNLTNALNLIP